MEKKAQKNDYKIPSNGWDGMIGEELDYRAWTDVAELADVIGGVSEKRRAEIADRSRASSSNVKKSTCS